MVLIDLDAPEPPAEARARRRPAWGRLLGVVLVTAGLAGEPVPDAAAAVPLDLPGIDRVAFAGDLVVGAAMPDAAWVGRRGGAGERSGVAAVDRRTGRRRWALPGVRADALLPVDDLVLVRSRLADGSGGTLAVDAATGHVRWRSDAAWSALVRGPARPALVALDRAGALVELRDVATGAVRAELPGVVPVGGVPASAPPAHPDLLVVRRAFIERRDADSGAVLHRRRLPPHSGFVAATDDAVAVVVVGEGNAGVLHVWSRADLAARWSAPLDLSAGDHIQPCGPTACVRSGNTLRVLATGAPAGTDLPVAAAGQAAWARPVGPWANDTADGAGAFVAWPAYSYAAIRRGGVPELTTGTPPDPGGLLVTGYRGATWVGRAAEGWKHAANPLPVRLPALATACAELTGAAVCVAGGRPYLVPQPDSRPTPAP
ncbi:MAG TPA: hypothetical protein VFY17_01625 [Pilimelia sp.]|nr:hypothetical protein [Pilimelia sp.]